MNDIILCYLELPYKVNGLVVPTHEGDYQIFINALLSAEQQRKTYNHEVRHLLLGHYEQPDRDIREVECEADRAVLLERIKDAEANGLPLETAILAPEKPAPIKEPVKTASYEKMLLRAKRAQLTGMWY